MAKKKITRQQSIDKKVIEQHEARPVGQAANRKRSAQINHSRKYGTKSRKK